MSEVLKFEGVDTQLLHHLSALSKIKKSEWIAFSDIASSAIRYPVTPGAIALNDIAAMFEGAVEHKVIEQRPVSIMQAEFKITGFGYQYLRQDTESPMNPLIVDSSGWTGTCFVLTDVKIINQIRVLSEDLKDTIYAMHFHSNSETDNLQRLADALVAACNMAEPEISIIERILASPKFQGYAALLAAVATIRGALGI